MKRSAENLRTAGIAVGALLVLASVGGPAAVASYRHAAKVASRYGETVAMADWLPLTTDGMLVAALVVMYYRRWVGDPVGKGPWLAFGAGMVATLAANFAAADIPTNGIGGVAVAMWPPLAFAITLELGGMMVKTRAPVKDTPTPKPKRLVVVDEATPVPADHFAQPKTRKVRVRPAPAPGLSDEDVVATIQAEIDRGEPLPTPRSVRSRFGMGAARTARVMGGLREPVTTNA